MNPEHLKKFVRSLDGMIAAYRQNFILEGSNVNTQAIVSNLEDARIGIVQQIEEIEGLEARYDDWMKGLNDGRP